jgi:hypothetical protein
MFGEQNIGRLLATKHCTDANAIAPSDAIDCRLY